jgi:hypothetical protein
VQSSWNVACIWLLCWLAPLPAFAESEDSCKGKLYAWPATAQTLHLSWQGEIADPIAECLQVEFDKAREGVGRVVLYLDSQGGYLPAMERAIATLQKIRKTHLLDTVVAHGRKCWSACVPVFLTGKRRSAALASTWLFHEVGVTAQEGGSRFKTVDRARSDRLFRDYYLAAGVSEAWLERLYIVIPHSNYWQTGQNLWDDKSGIITHPMDNLVPRGTERPKY